MIWRSGRIIEQLLITSAGGSTNVDVTVLEL